MKKILLTAIVISASVCAAYSQDQKATTSVTPVAKEAEHKSPEAIKAKEWQNLLATELKFTDEQVKKIADLNKAFGERRQAIEKNAELTDEAKKERKMALKKAWDTQYLQLLTPEQQTRYKELVEARNR